jgi:hypothetical protein
MSYTSKDSKRTFHVPERQDDNRDTNNTNTNINLPEPEAPYFRSAPSINSLESRKEYYRKTLEPLQDNNKEGGS